MNKEVWVYDIETLASVFTYSAINIDTQEIVKYIIHKDLNQLSELIKHLKQCKGHIGFNNNSFDYSVIHDILLNWKKWLEIYKEDESRIIDQIYSKAQEIINNQLQFGSSIKYKDIIIPQLDLFKLWHYNNKARTTSLKALEISMNYPNVMDMPIHHSKQDITLEEVSSILEYNLNDVLATYEFYKKSTEKIELRKSLIKQYKIPCINYSDSKIGESLILKLYCDETGLSPYEVRDMRSNRLKIALKECIFPYIKFQTKEFNELLDYFKSKTITETKGAIEKSLIYKNFRYDYGTGGIHGVIKSGIYESNNQFIIKSFDVGSLYPNLSIQNNLFPEHLGEDFVKVYKSIVDQRMKAKKEGNMAISDALKLSANSTYGKSNDKYSFLYDPKFTMSICISGQLSLSMLCESLTQIPGSQMIMLNTDGGEILIDRKYEDLFYFKCEQWEKLTKLSLEYVDYDKIIIGDVNNYLAVTTKGKVKNKGRFEVDKVVGNEPAYHKDNSFRIIPLALQEYFINNTPIKETILNHRNIYDFCGRQKFTKDSYGETHEIINYSNKVTKQQKNVRYYISNKGVTFVKQYTKGSQELIHKGYKVTIFNRFIELQNYDINYQYYINECNKEIENIIDKQLTLF